MLLYNELIVTDPYLTPHSRLLGGHIHTRFLGPLQQVLHGSSYHGGGALLQLF